MFCVQTWIVMFISLVGILFDYEVFGYTPLLFISDIMISLFLIVLVQWFCYNNGIAIAWLTTIVLVLIYFVAIYLWRIKNPQFMKIIEETKKN